LLFFLIFSFMNIYVSNLSFHTTDEDLNSMFGKFGQVTSAKVIMDKVSGRSRGFGFVEMSSEEEGKEAMLALNNKEIEGRAISVSVAREREERTGGGGGRSGSYSPRGGGSSNKRW
jgi:cold-inducible RNA-binding protein